MIKKWRDIIHKRRADQLAQDVREGKVKVQFPDTEIHVICWCRKCRWRIRPIGWYDSDGPVLLADLIALWQDIHNGDGDCREAIEWRANGGLMTSHSCPKGQEP